MSRKIPNSMEMLTKMALDGEQLEGEGKGGGRGISTVCLLPVVPEAPQHCLA